MSNISYMYKNILNVLGFVLVVDLFCFFAWVFSGQVAPDSYHLGIITESIIKLFI